ncbi:MAG: DUF3800 domain-containing protein [Bradyrhizobium sp.]
MLAAYFDDAGTHTTSRVVVWGGFMATADQWKVFDLAWRRKLARPLPGKKGLSKFGLADCRSRIKEFTDYSMAESDLLQNEFRQIIIDSKLVGLAYAVDRLEWDRLANAAAQAFFGDAETVVFSACFNGAMERADRVFTDVKMLSLHFDLGRKSKKLDSIVDRVTKAHEGTPGAVNISFDPVKECTPLQAADMIATENYWHAGGILAGESNPRPHFAHFLQRGHTNGYILQEAEILMTLKQYGF